MYPIFRWACTFGYITVAPASASRNKLTCLDQPELLGVLSVKPMGKQEERLWKTCIVLRILIDTTFRVYVV